LTVITSSTWVSLRRNNIGELMSPSVKDCAEWGGVTQSGAELLWSRRELTTKIGNNLTLKHVVGQ